MLRHLKPQNSGETVTESWWVLWPRGTKHKTCSLLYMINAGDVL
jgi:hypothetical protein